MGVFGIFRLGQGSTQSLGIEKESRYTHAFPGIRPQHFVDNGSLIETEDEGGGGPGPRDGSIRHQMVQAVQVTVGEAQSRIMAESVARVFPESRLRTLGEVGRGE